MADGHPRPARPSAAQGLWARRLTQTRTRPGVLLAGLPEGSLCSLQVRAGCSSEGFSPRQTAGRASTQAGPPRSLEEVECGPGWCGSVGRASSRGLKGPGFDSRRGHTPRWQAQSLPWLVRAGGNHPKFLCLSPSLPHAIKINGKISRVRLTTGRGIRSPQTALPPGGSSQQLRAETPHAGYPGRLRPVARSPGRPANTAHGAPSRCLWPGARLQTHSVWLAFADTGVFAFDGACPRLWGISVLPRATPCHMWDGRAGPGGQHGAHRPGFDHGRWIWTAAACLLGPARTGGRPRSEGWVLSALGGRRPQDQSACRERGLRADGCGMLHVFLSFLWAVTSNLGFMKCTFSTSFPAC